MTSSYYVTRVFLTALCFLHVFGTNVTSPSVTQPESISSNFSQPETNVTGDLEEEWGWVNATAIESSNTSMSEEGLWKGSSTSGWWERNATSSHVTVEASTITTSVPISVAPPTNTAPPIATAPPIGTAPPTTVAPPIGTAPPKNMAPPTSVAPPIGTASPTTVERVLDPETSAKNDSQSEHPLHLYKTWFVLTLEGNCSVITRGRQGQSEKSLKNQLHLSVVRFLNMEDEEEDLSITEIRCKAESNQDRIQVNFTACLHPDPSLALVPEAVVANLSSRLDQLEALRTPLLRVHDTDLFVYQIHLWDGAFLNREPEVSVDMRHTDVELVVYIAVGSSCAFLVTLAVVLLLCKYCCGSSSNSASDSSHPKSFDIPRSAYPDANTNYNNLRLEDYTLTRIPRPKFGYVDYYRGVAKRYSPLDDKMVTSSSAGMVRPFDTSLVPLEDAASAYSAPLTSAYAAPSARYYKDGVIVRPTDIRRFDSAIYAGSNDGFTRSNEYLHGKEAGLVEQGIDNPNFR